MTREASISAPRVKLSEPLVEPKASGGTSSLYVLWAFFAVAAGGAALAICFMPGAQQRFTAALEAPKLPPVSGKPPSAMARVEPEAAKPLAADPKVLARLDALEEQLTLLTGSIGAAKADTEVPPAGLTPGTIPVRHVRTTSIEAAAPVSDDTGTFGNAPAAPELDVTRTSFGLDLGSEHSFTAIRTRWDALRRKHPELARLSPRVAARDADGRIELRLVAGPYANAAEAAHACAALIAKGAACEGSLFDGQRLPSS